MASTVIPEEIGSNNFTISSAIDGRLIGSYTSLVNQVTAAETYRIVYTTSDSYALQKENDAYVTIDGDGNVQITSTAAYFNVFSVTY